MMIDGDWINAGGLQSILGMLNRAGHQAYMVGGCVRNALLGQPIADIDMATDALPERVAELASTSGLKVVPTGIAHGTVTVVAEGVGYEITTFRRDVETDGRRAVVAFGSDLTEDAARRDFTMNALYADATGAVFDPLGGLPDLLARRVRFVGDADDRIREDYLRILRFFRFHAWYGLPSGGMDADALAACAGNVDGLTGLSRERVSHEMRRLLAAPDPSTAVAAMQATGALHSVLPGADSRGLGPLIHLEPPFEPSWLRRLTVLGGENPTRSLRLSGPETRHLATMAEGLQNGIGAAELAYRVGPDAARDILLLRAVLLESPLTDDWLQQIEVGKNAQFPVAAADLMPGLSGPELGARLSQLKERWIRSSFKLSREQLLA